MHQRPNSPTSPPLSRLLLAIDNDGSYPLVVATVRPQHLPIAPITRLSQCTHRPLTPAFCASHAHLETKTGEPSSLHQPAPQMLLRALPAPPTQLRLLHGSFIFDFEICPIKSLNPSTSHKKDDCFPSLLPCTSSLRSATTFRLYASPPLHLISSLSTTLCLLSSPLLDELYCEMCKKQDLRTDLS